MTTWVAVDSTSRVPYVARPEMIGHGHAPMAAAGEARQPSARRH